MSEIKELLYFFKDYIHHWALITIVELLSNIIKVPINYITFAPIMNLMPITYPEDRTK
jgi:hypothetical protein